MGRKRTTPELQKLKAFEDSPDLADAKTKFSQKEQTFNDKKLTNNSNSSRIVTRSRRCAPKNIGQVKIAEKPSTKMDTEDASQKETSVLTPKMFYSKKCEKSGKPTKLSEKNEQDYIPSVKRSRRTVTEGKSKSDSNNWSEPYSHDKNEFPVIPSKKIPSKVNQRNRTNKKNVKNEIFTHSPSSESTTVLNKQNRIRSARTESKTQMTTQEVISELTNDPDIEKNILLPTTEKVNVADKVNLKSHSITDKGISVKKSKVIKPSNNIRNKKQNIRLSLADIVNEISPDSPEKKLPEVKDTKSIKKSQAKNVSGSAKKISDDWDHSLLLITDDFNNSGNIYDFEEFQIDGKKPTAKNSSAKKFEKKKVTKRSATLKASKAKKELSSQRKTKKLSSKNSKETTNTKKMSNKRIGLVTDTNPKIAPQISMEPQENSISSCGISVTDVPFQTPSIQKMKEPVSITELEKFKATKRIENKIVSKVKTSLSSDWPQLPDLPSQHFTKLRRGAMEGPTASDRLPENKPKSISIKTTSFNQSFLSFSLIDSDSPATKKPPAKVYSNKLDFKSSEKPALDNQPIDLFTYPIAMPTKKQSERSTKPGKCKQVKETPTKLMDFLYPGSVERYLEKPKENTVLVSPPPVMLPKFLRAETSTPNTTANCSPIPKSFGGESVCISPVKDFLSPASMRTYEHKSRRNSSAYLSIIKNADIFSDEPKENLQNQKTDKTKAKKKNGHRKTNKKFDEWANRMSNEFDEIEHFELSIET